MPRISKDDCFETLRLRILSLALAPGASLDEASLSKEFGLSRTPLREVLQRLSGLGYVTLEENRGAKVSSMDIGHVRDFFQAAPMVYAAISKLAAQKRSLSQLEELKAQQVAFRSAAQRDAEAAAQANHTFHALIGEMADNVYLQASLTRMLIDHTRLGKTFYRATTRDEFTKVQTAVAQHDALIAAFEAQDTDMAAEVTLAHWDLSRDQMERFVRPDPLPFEGVFS